MFVGESGVDYVVFGFVGLVFLGDGSIVELELFVWWLEMIEVLIVVEGDFNFEIICMFVLIIDFFGIGEEIWWVEDLVVQLQVFIDCMK